MVNQLLMKINKEGWRQKFCQPYRQLPSSHPLNATRIFFGRNLSQKKLSHLLRHLQTVSRCKYKSRYKITAIISWLKLWKNIEIIFQTLKIIQKIFFNNESNFFISQDILHLLSVNCQCHASHSLSYIIKGHNYTLVPSRQGNSRREIADTAGEVDRVINEETLSKQWKLTRWMNDYWSLDSGRWCFTTTVDTQVHPQTDFRIMVRSGSFKGVSQA